MKIFSRTVFAVFLACVSLASYAGCSTSSPGLAFGSVGIPADAPVGQVITSASTTATFSCNDTGTSIVNSLAQGVYNNWSFKMDNVGQGMPLGANIVFPTNIPGVGIAFRETSTNTALWGSTFCWTGASLGDICTVLPNGRCKMPGTCTLTVIAQLIKTGSFRPGDLSGNVLGLNYYAFGASTGAGYSPVSVSGSVRNLSCKTSDVTVSMAPWRISQFGGVGSIAATTDFNIVVTDCPPGINNITAHFAPTTAILHTGDSDFALSAASTARGVGIRLSDAAGPVSLNKDRALDYLAGASSATYRMKASYVKSEQTMTPGKVASALTFTMTYR